MTDQILFEDSLWSTELVKRLNAEVTSGKTACQIWEACSVLLKEAGESWDTAPREFMLIVLDARKTPGFDRLAERFGYIPKGLKALEPIDWDPEE